MFSLCVRAGFEVLNCQPAPMLNRSTKLKLTTSARMTQNECYGLPFFHDNALGGLCKTHNYIMSDDKKIQTVGEQRVRTSFNPSQTDVVAQIKQKSAELINLCEELKAKDGRLASLAQTSYEEAAMWAVKAATA